MLTNRHALLLMLLAAPSVWADAGISDTANRHPEPAGEARAMPSDKELEQAIADPQRRLRMPSAAEIEQASAPVTVPDIGGLAGPSNVDVGQLAAQMEQAGAGENRLNLTQPQLIAFISLEMPRESLKRILEQASKLDAKVVLRGMRNRSMRQTVAAIQEISAGSQTGAALHPQLFSRFGVNQVPAVVLALPGALNGDCQQTSCSDPRSYAKVSGDVTLDYALDLIARQVPELQGAAQMFLAKMQAK